jgi:putative hydrolase of the HAD superfamily
MLMEFVVKPKVIFFDFGDTLVHLKDSVYVSWARLLKKHQLASKSVKCLVTDINFAIRKEWADPDRNDINDVKDEAAEKVYLRKFYIDVLKHLGIKSAPGEVLDEFVRRQMDPSSYELFDDVIEALERFRSEDYTLGILSNAFPSATIIFDAQGISEYFDDENIFWSYKCPAKPKPDSGKSSLYKYALKQVGVQAQNAVFIDDRPHFVEGAQDEGMQAIFLDREGTYGECGAGLKIGSLKEIETFVLQNVL